MQLNFIVLDRCTMLRRQNVIQSANSPPLLVVSVLFHSQEPDCVMVVLYLLIHRKVA